MRGKLSIPDQILQSGTFQKRNGFSWESFTDFRSHVKIEKGRA